MCEFYDGCGHGDGPNSFPKGKGSCLQSLGCHIYFILAIIGMVFFGDKLGLSDSTAYGTIALILIIAVGIFIFGFLLDKD
jgi:cytochrome c biogenesis protein CcdA